MLDAAQVLRTLEQVPPPPREGTPFERAEAAVERARVAREAMLDAGRVRFMRSFALVTFPYPTRYGLRDAYRGPWPYLGLTNRVFVVQVDTDVGIATIMVSPSDAVRNAETPFFKGLLAGLGPLAKVAERAVTTPGTSVEAALAACGLAPEDVDFITYDHLHTQDLRGWLGDVHAPDEAGRRGKLPRARLLVMPEEWQTMLGAAAPQMPWYCPDGARGVAPERVIELTGDTMVGRGLGLFRTPGHTEGNHSIAVHTDEGIFVTSENGVAADAWTPRHSGIPGLKAAARRGVDVVLNGNTLERGLDQYFSMRFERELAGVSARDPRFANTLPSSELTATWYAPGLAPTLRFGDVAFGTPVRPVSLEVRS